MWLDTLLKVSKAKLVIKFVKKRIGMHIFAKRKQEELTNVLSAKRKAVAKKYWWPPLIKNVGATKKKKYAPLYLIMYIPFIKKI